MRDLKFRVFVGGQMIVVDESSSYTLTFGNARPSLAMFSNGGEFVCESTVDEVMQYTGLKDMNGVEIYEGDIVRTISHIGVVIIGNAEDMTINCNEYSLYYSGVYIDLIDTDVEVRCNFDGCRIVGNIHENPELVNT